MKTKLMVLACLLSLTACKGADSSGVINEPPTSSPQMPIDIPGEELRSLKITSLVESQEIPFDEKLIVAGECVNEGES